MEDIAELISRRRRQIILHSCFYYRLNDSIIDDHTFDYWCKELVELQQKYPEVAEKCVEHDKFKDFDGSTGFHLTFDPAWVVKAQKLLPMFKEKMKNGYGT